MRILNNLVDPERGQKKNKKEEEIDDDPRIGEILDQNDTENDEGNN